MGWIDVAFYKIVCPVLKLFLLMILNILMDWPLPKRVAWYDNDMGHQDESACFKISCSATKMTVNCPTQQYVATNPDHRDEPIERQSIHCKRSFAIFRENRFVRQFLLQVLFIQNGLPVAERIVRFDSLFCK